MFPNSQEKKILLCSIYKMEKIFVKYLQNNEKAICSASLKQEM